MHTLLSTRVTQPTVEPVSLADAKLHLRVTQSAEDDLIASLIVSARNVIEDECGLSLITTTWQQKLQQFPFHPNRIYFTRAPVVAITSITYTDSANATQTLSASRYISALTHRPAWVMPAYADVWPDARGYNDDVTVTYTAGFGTTAADVPASIKQAMLLLIGTMYEQREGVQVVSFNELPTVKALLMPHQWRFQ
jgi:uncharacterized phiE125 gp8 family phage protein